MKFDEGELAKLRERLRLMSDEELVKIWQAGSQP